MKILAVIPARYAAVRFPGKPLALISGKPMIQHVVERAKSAAGLDRILVATDDSRIEVACRSFGAEAVMTPPELPSGTDRVAFVARRFSEYGGILNIQGDEPVIEPETISAVAQLLSKDGVSIATAVTPFSHDADVANPNAVKAVVAEDGHALYFSRSPIPFVRNPQTNSVEIHFRHLGIYGFQRDTLLRLTALPPSPLEKAESLEQLRWLEAGYKIHCAKVSSQSIGVDSEQDLELVSAILKTPGNK